MVVITVKEFSYEEIISATEDFSVDKLIGKGSHGCVYKGLIKDFNCKHQKQVHSVAVKMISQGLQLQKDNTKLDNEISVLFSIRNPYIVNLLGVCRNGDTNKLLVMEFMPNGSLNELLHSSATPPLWTRRVSVALQVARALQSLHEASPPIVHRDIKPENVLLDKKHRARLADFSLAVRVLSEGGDQSPAAGTMGYMDPCYIGPEKLSTANDVFSFGVLLFELITGRRAFDAKHEPVSVVPWALPIIEENKGFSELFDPRLKVQRWMVAPVERMIHLAVRCVSLEEERRPTMAEAVEELEGVAKRVKVRSWLDMEMKIFERFNGFVGVWRRTRLRSTRIGFTNHVEEDNGIGVGNEQVKS